MRMARAPGRVEPKCTHKVGGVGGAPALAGLQGALVQKRAHSTARYFAVDQSTFELGGRFGRRLHELVVGPSVEPPTGESGWPTAG